jgi:hypothetical protein
MCRPATEVISWQAERANQPEFMPAFVQVCFEVNNKLQLAAQLIIT